MGWGFSPQGLNPAFAPGWPTSLPCYSTDTVGLHTAFSAILLNVQLAFVIHDKKLMSLLLLRPSHKNKVLHPSERSSIQVTDCSQKIGDGRVQHALPLHIIKIEVITNNSKNFDHELSLQNRASGPSRK